MADQIFSNELVDGGLAGSTTAAAAAVSPEDVLNRPAVATVIIPDREDPASVLRRGGLEVTWRDGMKTKKFKEVPCQKLEGEDIALPALYPHFLDERFKVRPGEFDPALRAGNDNAELQLVLPEMYTGAELPQHEGGEDLQRAIDTTLAFLKSEAMVPVSAVAIRPGSDPRRNYTVSADPSRWYFSLKTSRPKADINLDKELFDIPEESELYLFAENHISVNFMTREQQAAFEMCLNDLMEEGDEWAKFAVFVKIFYEGGFAYNKREKAGSGSYLPRTTGLAGLGAAPQREGQSGITTGYPYLIKPQFLNFSDSVPVTISAIGDMSHRHKRYGLCFTRCVYMWEDADFETTKTLSFCSLLPHGGFFYLPSTLEEFNREGGLVYAFGDKAGSLGAALASDQA